MNYRNIYYVCKADLLERTRRFSFLLICAAAMFLAFFSVPDVNAPFVSIAMEPNVFRQGSNPSWIPMAIALCGGILFPVIGLSYVKDSIGSDRDSGLLYLMQAMNLKRRDYVAGKFMADLILLTGIWLLVILSAAVMIPLRFPNEGIPVYDFLSPFLCIYPGILFAAAGAVLLECVPAIGPKGGNAVGITLLFALFLISFSHADSQAFTLRIVDYSGYRWLMDSINSAVFLRIGRNVEESGILVPGGMFAGTNGMKELVFHGLVKNGSYAVDKILLAAASLVLVLLAALLLETAEREKKAFGMRRREGNKNASGAKQIRQRHHAPRGSVYLEGLFRNEAKLLFSERSRSWKVLTLCLWLGACCAPLKYAQDYLWILMMALSATFYSQMGCRDVENGLADYMATVPSARARQLVCGFLCGAVLAAGLSCPVVLRLCLAGNASSIPGYLLFSLFTPALACCLGVYCQSRRPFETVFLMLCFLLINVPAFLSAPLMTGVMAVGGAGLLGAACVKSAGLFSH